jgi:N-acetylmuramoyl-L-alanine amidase
VTYRVLTDLADVCRAGGCNVIEYGGWQSRGRPSSTGCFDPRGVLCHHTASPDSWSDADDLNCILAGNSSAPGPISQLYLSRFEPWPVYIVAAGRANHGGKGAIPGEGCGDMNCALLGIEAGQSGSTYWPDGMVAAYAKLVKALCTGYGWSVNQVFLHATTGQPCGNSKIDPSGPWLNEPHLPLGNPGGSTWNLETWRAYVNSAGPGPTPPRPITPTEDDMAKCIIHVDESQPAGSPGYSRFNAVWNWSGAWRYHLPSELGVKSAVYENTGDAAVFNAALGDIVNNPAWVQRVGSLDGYGAVAGNDPGDI